MSERVQPSIYISFRVLKGIYIEIGEITETGNYIFVQTSLFFILHPDARLVCARFFSTVCNLFVLFMTRENTFSRI